MTKTAEPGDAGDRAAILALRTISPPQAARPLSLVVRRRRVATWTR